MKAILAFFGIVSLILGIIGIVVPLLPTTPFLLLSAALFFRSSPRLYNWLLNHRIMGRYIRNFREFKAIPLHAKIISISLICLTLGYAIFFVAPYLWLKCLLLILGICVSLHILSYKTLK